MPKKLITVGLFLFFQIQGLGAHPHLFVKSSIAVKEIKSNQIILAITWEWDQWWSDDILSTCDQNKDGMLNTEDIELVYRDYFKNINNFHYFTWVKLKNQDQKYLVQNFKASVSKERVVIYDFEISIDFDETKLVKPYPMTIIFNDQSTYTAFDAKITINDPKGKGNYQNIKSGVESFYGVKIDFVYHPAP